MEDIYLQTIIYTIKYNLMASPYIHAESSAKKWGGVAEDYLEIHQLLDSTKAAFSDNRHRILTHNSWFSTNIIPLVFGHKRMNSAGREYIPKDVAEQHILEDYRMKFIPTVQDWVEKLPYQPWMNNGLSTLPRLDTKKEMRTTDLTDFDFKTTTID